MPRLLVQVVLILLLLLPAPVGAEPILDEIVDIVQRNFYDPQFGGVDFPKQASALKKQLPGVHDWQSKTRLINQLLSILHSSHTVYYSPEQKGYYELLGVFSSFGNPRYEKLSHYDGIGMETLQTPQGIFVKALWDGFPAQQAGLLTGDRIHSVDGQPFQEILPYKGKQTVSLRIERTPGDFHTIRVPVQRLSPAKSFETALLKSVTVRTVDGYRLGYLHVWSYAGERYHEIVRHELCQGRLTDCDGVVLDLREGWGGAAPDYLNLFNPNVSSVQMKMRGRPWASSETQWRRPVVLLVNENTRSGKEILAHGFRRYKLGPVVGENTPGAVLAGRPYLLKGGGLLYLAVADVLVDGQRLEGVGVTPDIRVPREIPYSKGADPQKEKAFEVLRGLTAASSEKSQANPTK